MIWIIGCKGQLGTEIARQFTEKKVDYVGTDIDIDITDPQALAKFVIGKSISYIINCSAYTAVDRAEIDVELAKKLNEEGPRNIANLANQIHAKMIHISTDYVFDGASKVPYTEDMPISPIGVYGITKVAGEAAVRQNLKEYYIIRTAWLYGWAGKNFVYTIIKAMNTHDSIKVVNDQKGSPTFASNLASIIIKIINYDRMPYGTYHCTDIGEITWWDFAIEIKKIAIDAGYVTNRNCVVNSCTTEDYPSPARRPAYSVLSKNKIQKALGFELPDWREGVKAFIYSDFFDKERIK